MKQEKWIPVADGLPDRAGYYWVTIRGNVNKERRAVGRAHFDTDFGWNCSFEVIAWMTRQHKPEPYRGDVQETQHRQKQTVEWIPVTYGQDEDTGEIKLTCQLPDEGERVLVADSWGYVWIGEQGRDSDGWYLDDGYDWLDVVAWAPLPDSPYQREERQHE